MTDNISQNKKTKSEIRLEKTNEIIDEEVVKMLKELSLASDDLDTIIEIMTDRVVQSTDAVLAIALARFMEIRADAFKKRNDIIKTLVSDKNSEVNSRKKHTGSDIDSILSGLSLGAALGATVSTKASINQKKADKTLPFTTIDVTPEEGNFETEYVDNVHSAKDSSIDNLLSEE